MRGDLGRHQPIELSRAFSAGGRGQPATHLLEGSAPAGTTIVVLTAPGVAEQRLPAFDAGPRWGNRAYFLAAWPSSKGTTVRALGADGQTLALQTDKGMNLRATEPAYLAEYADCLEEAGGKVVRHPQAGGSGPMYEYGLQDLAPEEVRRLEATCEARANAALD